MSGVSAAVFAPRLGAPPPLSFLVSPGPRLLTHFSYAVPASGKSLVTRCADCCVSERSTARSA